MLQVHRLSTGFRHYRYSDGSRKRRFFTDNSQCFSAHTDQTREFAPRRVRGRFRLYLHFTKCTEDSLDPSFPELALRRVRGGTKHELRTVQSARRNQTRTSHCSKWAEKPSQDFALCARGHQANTSHCSECAERSDSEITPVKVRGDTKHRLRTAQRTRNNQHNTMREVTLDED